MSYWKDKIKAFLHDPPDKALILGEINHEKRRDAILKGINLNYDTMLDIKDHMASAMQRINLPKELAQFAIYFRNKVVKPVFKHTLSGVTDNLDEIKEWIKTYGYKSAIEKYGCDTNILKRYIKYSNGENSEIDWKKTYFYIWRYLPKDYNLGYFLPADTRIPDHSIWDHLDVTAGIIPCNRIGLFALKISAVQEFITQSRKLSDLWSSSYIFSLLIFEGIKVIIEEFGPDAIIYPHLRDNPLFDLYLQVEPETLKDQLKVANIPNTFLSFISIEKAEEIARKCDERIMNKWKEIASCVQKLISEKTDIQFDEKTWNNQVEQVLSISIVWSSFINQCMFRPESGGYPSALIERQKEWLSFVNDREIKENCVNYYYFTYEILSSRLSQVTRFWSHWEEKPITGKKCLMCGKRNAIIEKNSEGKYYYWNANWLYAKNVDMSLKHLLKEKERLCSVCLIKRVYPRIFEREFKFSPLNGESVVFVAAKDFIDKVSKDDDIKKVINWDVELVYEHEWSSEEKNKGTLKELKVDLNKVKKRLEEFREKYGEPNKYYAILLIDGDKIGKTLSGENLPEFGEFLHPAFKDKIVNEWDKGKLLVETKRMLSPSHHIAISRAMKDFSLYVVPKIIERYNGLLIYSGGDDVLALLPANKALIAAQEIQSFFKKDFYEVADPENKKRKIMGLGQYSSMSAGIVYVHYKYPLYDALNKVRKIERMAKSDYKRNAFCISFIKKSGSTTTAGGKWHTVNMLLDISEQILNDIISHRFIYDFIAEVKMLGEKELKDLLISKLKWLLNRRKTEKASVGDIENIQNKLIKLIDIYLEDAIPLENIGNALKILYDAQRSEEQ